MIKQLLFLSLFAVLLALGYFTSSFFIFKDRAVNLTPSSPQCDLNIQECSYDFNGKKILVSIQPKPLQAMQDLKLNIENLPHYENLELKIYGLNMFMGEIKPKLIPTPKGYEAEILLSACTLDKMLYRAEFFQNGKTLKFHFDFELRR